MPQETRRTGVDTHRATRRGYANGVLTEEGEAIPAGMPLGSWMEAGKPRSPIDPKQPGRFQTVSSGRSEL
jgi:hypothetical protein